MIIVCLFMKYIYGLEVRWKEKLLLILILEILIKVYLDFCYFLFYLMIGIVDFFR